MDPSLRHHLVTFQVARHPLKEDHHLLKMTTHDMNLRSHHCHSHESIEQDLYRTYLRCTDYEWMLLERSYGSISKEVDGPFFHQRFTWTFVLEFVAQNVISFLDNVCHLVLFGRGISAISFKKSLFLKMANQPLYYGQSISLFSVI